MNELHKLARFVGSGGRGFLGAPDPEIRGVHSFAPEQGNRIFVAGGR